MKLDSIINDFKSYLNELNEISNQKYDTSKKSFSIFSYLKEFQNFLKNNSDVDIKSINIMDLMNLEFKDGQYSISDNNDDASINDMLNIFLSDDKMKNAVDTDGDGNVSKEEANVLLDTIKNLDNNSKNISINDIFNAVEGINDGSLEFTPVERAQNNVENNSTTGSTEGASGGGGSYGGGGGGGGISGSSGSNGTYNANSTNQEKTLDNMTKEELQSELSTAESELTEKQNAVSDILDGSDSEIKKLEETKEKAYEAYQKELKEQDEDMAKEVDTLKGSIDEKQSEVDSKEQEICNQETTVSNCETEYNNAVSNRENLESILSSLQGQNTSSDSDKAAEIQSQIAEVEAQIAEAKETEEKAKTEWDEAKEKLETLKEEKETAQTELDELNEQMTKLEEQISKKYPEVQKSMDEYNDAEKALSEGKETALTTAKSDVQEAQDEVNKIKTAIQNYDNKEKEKEYTKSGLGEETIATAEKYLGLSESEVESATGRSFYDGLWCADFVHAMLAETYGDNLPDWYKNCDGKSSCGSVLDSAQAAGKAYTDASQAQAGDLIIFNTSRGSAHHIGIVEKVENGIVYTIEGNTWGDGNSTPRVMRKTYEVTNTGRINSYIHMS